MSGYLTLSEAAQYVKNRSGRHIGPAELLRIGVHGALLIAAPFNGLMRNLTSHKNDDVLGLLVIPPRHLFEIETDGQAKITGAFSLDGSTAYSPQVERTRDQLRVLESELDRLMLYWVTDNPQQQAPTSTPATNATPDATATPIGAIQSLAVPDGAGAPSFALHKPKRFNGYGKMLFDFLLAAQKSGKNSPKARDVLDAWKLNRPSDVHEVTDSGFKYYDSNGTVKPVDLAALRKAMGRMTG